MQTQTIKAKYKHGVLQLPEKLDIPEGAEVMVRLEASDATSARVDGESRVWLDANLSEPLPPYDWGKDGIPNVRPVRYRPGVGFFVMDETV